MQLVDGGEEQGLHVVCEVAEGAHVFEAHLSVVDDGGVGEAGGLDKAVVGDSRADSLYSPYILTDCLKN